MGLALIWGLLVIAIILTVTSNIDNEIGTAIIICMVLALFVASLELSGPPNGVIAAKDTEILKLREACIKSGAGSFVESEIVVSKKTDFVFSPWILASDGINLPAEASDAAIIKKEP